MKTKNKMLAMLEIAIVLCSVFLIAIPAIAAQEQNQGMQKASTSEVTTASEDDYVLGIYGNANEDDTIDMGDVVYTKLAIFGKKPKTELCDAKYDGRINVLDVIQTKLIILGKEKELTLIDSGDRIVTFKKPVKSIVVNWANTLEALRSVNAPKDIVVGVPTERWLDPGFFPEFVDVPVIGEMGKPDTEVILNINPDAAILYWSDHGDRLKPVQDALELAGITVFRFKFGRFDYHRGEMEKLGYIVGKTDEAKEYLDWRENILNSIKEEVEKIPEEDKPKVYIEGTWTYSSYSQYGRYGYIAKAGGKDIFVEVKGKVDPEAVIKRNPDIILKVASSGGVSWYDMDAGDTTKLEEIREEIMNRPELQEVKAVKKGEVYVITTPLLNYYPRSGCREFIQIAYQAKWFHPELFEDLDPKAIHQEYITRFQGLDIDFDEKGVFVYPEPS